METTVSDALRVWAIKTRPTCSAVGHLLKALRPFHVDLPLDYRTLMRTPRASVWKNVGTGKYIHMGLAKSISALIPHRHNSPEYLHLQLHVDGLTMWNSSRYQLWPILGRILKPFLTTPFVVGVYGGMEKPSDVSEYLSDVILELRDILQNGVPSSNGILMVRLCAILCDKPARAFLQQGMSHTSYGGCDKCEQRGRYVNHRMTFPSLSHPLRTNAKFRASRRRQLSPFESLPLDMIHAFPIDYMHAVCLGVVRRLINLWFTADVRYLARLTSKQHSVINQRLLDMKAVIPSDFPRKCRQLDVYKQWKATEFRQFLLYLGPAALVDILNAEQYDHFLDLSIFTYILCHPVHYSTYAVVAANIIDKFIRNFSRLYGRSQMVYNVHVLSHLVDCCARHGCLDQFSCFPFESYMYKIKRFVVGRTNVLSQIDRRCSEVGNGDLINECRMPRYLSTSSDVPQLLVNGSIVTCTMPDNIVIVDGKPGQIVSIVRADDRNNPFICVSFFRSYNNFYFHCFPSSNFYIFKVGTLDTAFSEYPVSAILYKCIKVPLGDRHLVIPLLHTSNINS